MRKFWIVLGVAVVLALIVGAGWLHEGMDGGTMGVPDLVREGENAAPLYIAALGVPEGMMINGWCWREGRDENGMVSWFERAYQYRFWLGVPDDPRWNQPPGYGHLHPHAFEQWVDENSDFFEAISHAARAGHMDDSDVLIPDAEGFDMGARVLAMVADTLFSASLAHARKGDLEQANARFLDALHVMRHSFQSQRAIHRACMTIGPMHRAAIIATLPNDDLPGMDAYLNDETKRQALDVLKSLDPEDPFEYRRAFENELGFVLRVRSPGVFSRSRHRSWTRDAIRAWTEPNALELLRGLDERTPSSVLYPSAPFVGERENDRKARGSLRKIRETLESIAGAEN